MLYINLFQKIKAKKIRIGNISLYSYMDSLSEKYDIRIVDEKFIKNFLPKRDRFANKFSFGKALMVCGSYGMAGAAALAAKAAFSCGCGYVNIAIPDSAYPVAAEIIPEAVFAPLPDSDHLKPEHIDKIQHLQSSASAILIGCGLSLSEETKTAVKEILSATNIPAVIDADGINSIADSIEILERTNWEKIITPHHGEMARLCSKSAQDIQEDFISVAADFAKEHNTIVVLKGAVTAIADPSGKVFVNFLKGNSGMAVAGCGDMLAGMICAFLAAGCDCFESSAASVYLHASAGDRAAKRYSERSITPTDMIAELPYLFK